MSCSPGLWESRAHWIDCENVRAIRSANSGARVTSFVTFSDYWWLTVLDVTILKPYETLQSEDKRTGLEQSSGFPKAQATGSTPVGGNRDDYRLAQSSIELRHTLSFTEG